MNDLDALDDVVPLEIKIYELLWRARVRIHLPETLVYKFGRLESWFFSVPAHSKPNDPPLLKRKRDYTVRRGDTKETILHAFCAHCRSEHEIVATWVSGAPGTECRVLHLTKATLAKFLSYMPEKGHGVLQRWVAPVANKSTLLRTDWSPHYFAVEMCTNWHSTTDPKLPLGQRLATFEGNVRHVSLTTVINQSLHAKVEQQHRVIADAIGDAMPAGKVWRLQANFKPGADGCVHFIWCSVLAIEAVDAHGFVDSRIGAAPAPAPAPAPPPPLEASPPHSPDGGGTASTATSPALSPKIGRTPAPPSQLYRKPRTRGWHGRPVACDGSIFHIPLPGMTTFRPPTWWQADQARHDARPHIPHSPHSATPRHSAYPPREPRPRHLPLPSPPLPVSLPAITCASDLFLAAHAYLC